MFTVLCVKRERHAKAIVPEHGIGVGDEYLHGATMVTLGGFPCWRSRLWRQRRADMRLPTMCVCPGDMPLSRFMGATPARAAICLLPMVPNSGS